MDAIEFLRLLGKICSVFYQTPTKPCKDTGCPIAAKFGNCVLAEKTAEDIEEMIFIVKEFSSKNPKLLLTKEQKIAIHNKIEQGYVWARRNIDGGIFFLKHLTVSKGTVDTEHYVSPPHTNVCYERDNKHLYGFIKSARMDAVYLPDLLDIEKE